MFFGGVGARVCISVGRTPRSVVSLDDSARVSLAAVDTSGFPVSVDVHTPASGI